MKDETHPKGPGRPAHLTPSTKLGRLSSKLLAALLGIFAVAVIVSLLAGNGEPDDSFDVYRAVIGLAFVIVAIGASVTAAIAIVRDGERSIVSWLAVLLGLLAVGFALGDQF